MAWAAELTLPVKMTALHISISSELKPKSEQFAENRKFLRFSGETHNTSHENGRNSAVNRSVSDNFPVITHEETSVLGVRRG